MCMCTHIHTYVCTFKIHWLIIRSDSLPLNSVGFWLLHGQDFAIKLYVSMFLFVPGFVCHHCQIYPGYTRVVVMLSVTNVLGFVLLLTPWEGWLQARGPPWSDECSELFRCVVLQGCSLCSRCDLSQGPRKWVWRTGRREVTNSGEKRALLVWPTLPRG